MVCVYVIEFTMNQRKWGGASGALSSWLKFEIKYCYVISASSYADKPHEQGSSLKTWQSLNLSLFPFLYI